MFDFVYQFLSKLGYTHPIHPTEVHMPIGLVVGALVFAIIAIVFRRQTLAKTARHCIILAFIFLFPTILFGFMDWQHYYGGTWFFEIKMKLLLASVLLILLLVAILLGWKRGAESKGVLAVYSLCFITVVALGYFGGQLVFGSKSLTYPDKFKAGEKIFETNCSGCHPHGGNIIKPNFPLRGSPEIKSFERFSSFIQNPRMPDGSEGLMPPFPQSKIPEKREKQLYDYIVNVLNNPRGDLEPGN